MSHLLARKPTRLSPSRATASAVHTAASDRFRPCKQPRLRSASLHFRRGPLRWRSQLRHTREDTGPGRLSARRPPARAALGGFRSGYRPGCVPPVPETSCGPIASPTVANSDLTEIGTADDPTEAPDARRTSPLSSWPTPASHCINLVARSSLDAAACSWRTPHGTRAKTRARSSSRFSVRLRGPPSSAPLRLPARSPPTVPRLRAGQ
jgi:hypothetical protein